jgi:hypothetical protein
MKIIATLIALATFTFVFAESSSAGRNAYGGGRHTVSHGGTYVGGSGSSHKGGTYVPHSGYGTHK